MATLPVRRILVVDDEEDVRQFVALVLRRCGYEVQDAFGAREALIRLSQGTFALMITDVKMPGMDGLALLEQTMQRYPKMDAIVLTAYGTIQTAVTAMKRGAIDYMTKPFTVEELENKVAACFDRRARAAERADERIAPLVELTRIMSSQLDLSDILESLIDLIQRALQPAGIEVAAFDSTLEGGALVVRSGVRLPEEALERLSVSQVHRLAKQTQPWNLQRVRDGEWRRLVDECVTVPLAAREQVVGSLTLLRAPSDSALALSDVQLLQVFGAQIGLSMLHARTRQQLLDASRIPNSQPYRQCGRCQKSLAPMIETRASILSASRAMHGCWASVWG